MNATSILGAEIEPLPPFAGEPMPSGDTSDGLVLAMNPATGKLKFQRAHIACGPSALGENMGLIGRQHNFLWSDAGEYGMRGGLAAYIPSGVWNLDGSLVIAGLSGVEYDVCVWQGMALSQDPLRPGIVSENAQIVGGGVTTWAGGNYLPFQINFRAHMLQFIGESPLANEIGVSVYPKCDGPAGAALSAIDADSTGHGGLPNCFVSSFMIRRERGI